MSTRTSPRALLAFATLAAAALALTGCQKDETDELGSSSDQGSAETASADHTITPEARKEAEQIFSTRCAACHGEHGKGDGPASAGLDPHPRNFTDPAWQKSVTDEHIEKIIQFGGAAVGKSPAMPANPDLQAKPAVVAGLREHVRQLSGK